MRFKLRQMEVFRAVMLTGSMNGAAKLLFVSQPAVSRLIAHAEQSLGLQLFARDKGKLTPTPEAQRLFEEVGPLFEEALRIDELARDLAARPEGALTLCASPSLALNFLPPAIARYLELHPGVRLKFHTTLLADMAHELLGRKAELAISVLPVDHPNLVVEPLATGEMVCILPEGHPLAAQPREPGAAGGLPAGALQPQHSLRPAGGGGLPAGRRELERGGRHPARRGRLRAGAGGRRRRHRRSVLGGRPGLARRGGAAAARIDPAVAEPGALALRAAQPAGAAFRAPDQGTCARPA